MEARAEMKRAEIPPAPVVFKTAYPVIAEGDYYYLYGQSGLELVHPDLNSAIRYCEKVLESVPDDPRAHVALANIYKGSMKDEV